MQDYNPPFDHRRVNFLRGCPSDIYLHAMAWLGRHGSFQLVTYLDINNEINVGRVLHYICGHLIFWVDPAWRPPYKTSAEAVQTFYDYEDLIRNKYLGKPKYGDDEAANEAIDEGRVNHVNEYMVSLRKRVRKDYYEWNKIKQNVSAQ
jgi:hypothetical protein